MTPVSTYTWPSQPIPVTSGSSNVHDSNSSYNSSSSYNKSQHTLHTLHTANITTCLTASDLLNTDLNPTSTSTSSRLIVTDMKYDGLWSLIVTVVDCVYRYIGLTSVGWVGFDSSHSEYVFV